MRILITGGCGFLGAHLTEHFLKTTDAEIVILDKLTYASSGFDRLRDIQIHGERGVYDHVRLKFLGCDLSNPIPQGIAQEIGPIDYVIHAAAETHVDNSITEPLPFIKSNVEGTHHLLWWLRSVPTLKRAFLVSTDEVYGPAAWDSPGNVETDPFRPANPYAAAKAGGEAIGMAYANTYRLPITIVNTMNLYGERQHPEKFIPLVINKVLRGEMLPIHADQTRTRPGTRFYIHCRNYASAIAFLIRRDLEWRSFLDQPKVSALADPQTELMQRMPLKIHVAGEREISNLDLAQMIAGFVGKPLNYELVDFHSSRPGHDLRYALDDSKIRSMGWSQPFNTEESLRKTVQWFLDNPRWLDLKKEG